MSKPKAESKNAQYHCDFCGIDITNQIRIRCAECNDFDLCLSCFASGVELYPHKPDHPYRVIGHVTQPIFEDEWGADEELLLLEGIEMYGLGNWGDVADHVGNKTKTKCEQHYYQIYLNSSTAPLPDLQAAVAKGASRADKKDSDDVDAVEASAASATDGAKNTAKGAGKGSTKLKTGLGHVIGYMAKRGDFDTEYDNDAELILADMEFKADDTEIERNLKQRILSIYNEKLDQRYERKQFIFQRGLLDPKDKKYTKEERQIEQTMRPFARFHSQPEHERFVDGLIAEYRLRKRIEQLQSWRMNGIRTIADGERFESEKTRREASSAAGAAGGAGSDIKLKLPLPSADGAGPNKSRKRGAAALGDDNFGSASKKGKLGTGAGGALLDITGMDGYNLLSDNERKLCSELQLMPVHYFAIKNKIVQEFAQKGSLDRANAGQLLQIDIRKTNRLIDWFVSCGWVNTEATLDPTAIPPTVPAGAARAPSPAPMNPANAIGIAALQVPQPSSYNYVIPSAMVLDKRG